MENQFLNFFVFVIAGFIVGIIFDFFRILRKSFKTSNFITYIEDCIFGILSGSFILYLLFKFNNGELRAYIFISIILRFFII